MASITIKIPSDMETDMEDAFYDIYPPADPTTPKDVNLLNRIDQYVSTTYTAYMDKQAETSIKDGAIIDYDEEKDKNKDKAKEIEVK